MTYGEVVMTQQRYIIIVSMIPASLRDTFPTTENRTRKTSTYAAGVHSEHDPREGALRFAPPPKQREYHFEYDPCALR